MCAARTDTPPADDLVVHATTALSGDERARWDAFVDRVPGSDVNQLTAWAGVRATLGFRALHVLVHTADDGLLGGMQVLYRRMPGLGAVGYVPSGPVLVPVVGRRRPARGRVPGTGGHL